MRRGEILGLAGLVGSGRTELARAVFGIDRMIAGAIRLDGTPIKVRTPSEAIAHGIYLVPEDRKQSGLLLDFAIIDNISLPDLPAYASFALVSRRRETANAEVQRRRLNIRAPSVATPVLSLSGGNQQKVVLAKWLSMKPRVMIFDEPTRGVDVGAKKEIYEMLRGLADAGVAVLMISSDMEEVIGVSDRIAVMHEGAIGGFLDRQDFSEHNVLRLAVGAARFTEGEHEQKRSGAACPHPGGRHHRGNPPAAVHRARQHRQHRQPDRPVRPVRDRPGLSSSSPAASSFRSARSSRCSACCSSSSSSTMPCRGRWPCC